MPVARCEVAIVGAGIIGAALAYALARYSDVGEVCVLEKEASPASRNSAATQNSQTLHCGDIETNYSLDKAAEVKQAAGMVERYVRATGETGILHVMPKMLLGVGEAEVAQLHGRFEQLQPLFPAMRLLDAAGIAQLEPAVARRQGRLRREPLAALALPPSPCAADFGALAASFLRQAARCNPRLTLRLGCLVRRIERLGAGYRIELADGTLHAASVAVCAGAHSLSFAHALGYARELAILPVAGSFFHAPLMVSGKVYTLQDARLPFAAIHADPDITVPGRMRLGPTAMAVPFLERRVWRSVPQFLRMLRLDASVLATFGQILSEPHLRRYATRNLLYELPLLGRGLFLAQARKILPDLAVAQLRYARGHGGLRPQLVDLQARRLYFGTARIDGGVGLLFNVTPSPGASSCLAIAAEDAGRLCTYLGRRLHRAQLAEELLGEV